MERLEEIRTELLLREGRGGRHNYNHIRETTLEQVQDSSQALSIQHSAFSTQPRNILLPPQGSVGCAVQKRKRLAHCNSYNIVNR
jgi:hypothetical protein